MSQAGKISVANPMHTGNSSARRLSGVPPMETSSAPFNAMDSPRNVSTIANSMSQSAAPKTAKAPKNSGFLGCGKKSAVEENRFVHLNIAEPKFGNNYISTSKYTLLSFVPRSLFEQFRRVANIYFLGISVLMLIGTFVPQIFESPLSAYSTLGPLCLVLFITMVKEGAEDYKRHRSDYHVNNRRCTVIEPDGTERQYAWKDLRVGMVIKVENKSEVPADVILLQTSESKAACYIETSNIDGETNLKLKEGLAPTAALIRSINEAGKIKGDIEYEGPNDRIHTFTGKMRVGTGQYVAVGARNMVLRGCTLRNTKWILGIVTYTGSDTKVMKKSGGARSKMSQVEKTMNMCIKVIFGAQFVLCTVATVALVLWNAAFSDQYPYLHLSSVETYIPSWLGQWFTFLVLFNNFIPISLYVTVEMVNYAQAWLIDKDVAMYDPVSDTPAKARTSNLNQDLGQIEYVFSDKTGTLTRNVMEFKQCSIAGSVYGVFVPEAEEDEAALRKELRDHENEEIKHRQQQQQSGGCCSRGRPLKPSARDVRGGSIELSPGRQLDGSGGLENPFRKAVAGAGKTPASSGFEDPALMGALRHAGGSNGFGAAWTPDVAARAAALGNFGSNLSHEAVVSLEAFFTCMAVCHTVVPEVDEKNPNGPPVFQAESPDEGALAKAARDVGFEFVQRNADHIIIDRRVGDSVTPLRFDVYGVHEFNSTRKRMAVVAQGPDGKILLMVKGADNVIFERSCLEPYRATIEEHLREFASVGLRTLVLAQREMSRQEFEAWRAEYHEASVALVDREGRLTAVAEKYETDLHVLGATAIEDRLQDGVPGTIRDLARAGIKTWVLTGDKVETAINIGFSCRLLEPSMELIQITSEDDLSIRQQLAWLEKKFLPLVERPKSFLSRFGGKRKVRTLSETHLAVPITKSNFPSVVKPTGSINGSINGNRSPSTSPDTDSSHTHLHTDMAVIVTGPALTHILGKREVEQAFLTVARCCRAVIACRVSPQQKALIVKLVRKGITPSPMTLAIGDGANDVGMIQRAEVGVGISGKEGLQAVNSADFAIAQFRFLRRLLLVHGRWDYRRMTKVVLYSFYKNVVITFSLFYFTALTGFSGTSFYESNVYSTYNFVLGLPIIFAGILDQDISAKTALDHPSVYSVGLRYRDLNMRKILTWIWWAVLHSVIVFWLVYGIMGPVETSWGSDGLVGGMASAGLTQFNVLVWAMQFEVCMQTISWTWLNYFFLALSMSIFYAFLLGYSQMDSFSPDFYGVALRTFSSPSYWLVILLMFGVMLILDYTAELVRRMYFPSDTDIAMERDRGYGTPNSQGYVPWEDDIEDDKAKAVGSNVTAISIGPAATDASGVRPVSPATTRSMHGSGVLDSKAVSGGSATLQGAYRDYVNVPKEVVLEGSTPGARQQMGVHDAAKRTGYDYSYPSGKPGHPISPYSQALDDDDD